MLYEFVDDEGTVHAIEMPMREAVSIGSTIERDGRRLTRIASGSAQVDPGHNRWQFPRVSHSLPHRLPGCKHDAAGRVVVRNRREEKSILSRLGLQKE
jgi:hypothetical protein